MLKKQKSMLVLAMVTAFVVAVLLMPGLVGAGDLEPPTEAVDESGNPKGSGRTLEEIYNKLEAIENGVNFNRCINLGERFCDPGDGTVLDIANGLFWLKNANCFGRKNWYNAGAAAAALADGECGLTDGSQAGDWRLPTKEELEGIGTDPPATWNSGYPPVTWTMPGSPFENVQSYFYWSSTTHAAYSSYAWSVHLSNGFVGGYSKDYNHYVWPVRPDNW